MSSKSKRLETLAGHAEMWARDQHGYTVPLRGTDAWKGMYQDWIGFAFQNFPDIEDNFSTSAEFC